MTAVARIRSEVSFDLPVPHRIVLHETLPAGGADPLKPAVFMVHGLTRNAGDFDAAAEALAVAGYRCLAPDMPGRGESPDLPNPALYHLGLYVSEVAQMMAGSGIKRAAFVGTSMGGMIGMALAAAERTLPPEGRLIGTLIVNDVGSFIPAKALERVTEAAENYPIFESEAEAAEAFARKMAGFGMVPEYLAHLTRRAFRRTPDGKWHYAYDPAIASIRRTAAPNGVFTDADLSPAWNAVDCPAYVFRGAESDLLTAETLHAMRAHPRFQGAFLVQGAGHAPMLETPAQINALKAMIEGSYQE